MVPALSLGKFFPTGKLTPESENTTNKRVYLHQNLTYLQEEQSDEQEQPKVFLKLFQPRIDKFEHYN